MYLECTCADITKQEWDQKMKGSQSVNYDKLVKKIKKELPSLYDELMLDVHNPYGWQSRANKDYYILVHSMIEYFIHK